MKIGYACVLSKHILCAFYDYFLTVKGNKDSFLPFLKCFKAISSFHFMQIFFFFLMAWKKNQRVAYDIMIQCLE